LGSYLTSRGEPPGQLLRELGLPPETLLGSDIWLPRDAVLDLTHSVERLTGDVLFGFRLGELFDLQNYGKWTEQLLKCDTLGEALHYVCRQLHQLETGTRMSLHRQGDTLTLRSELVGSMSSDPRHQYDGHMSVLVKVLRTAAEPFAVTLRLPHDCRHLGVVEEILGLEVVASCPHAELVFPAGALELPLTTRRAPSDHEVSRAESICREVFHKISTAADREQQTVAGIAKDLSLNVRTMQRHLSAWGVSFEEILDGYRRHRALELLLDSGLSVTHIAHGLGYSDAAHFTRAFRRWYDVSPRSARRGGDCGRLAGFVVV
jgi:AraC-like DNA-binding protein